MKEYDEKLENGEIALNNRFVSWLDNFWYHYKWHVIAVVFFLLTALVCFAQCSSKETGDLTIAYAGGYTMTKEEHDKIIDVMEIISPKKENGEKLSVMMATYSIYTDEEMKLLYTDEDGELSVSGYQNAKKVSLDHFKTFQTYLQTEGLAPLNEGA